MGVRFQLELVFVFDWNERSNSIGIGVRFPLERAYFSPAVELAHEGELNTSLGGEFSGEDLPV